MKKAIVIAIAAYALSGVSFAADLGEKQAQSFYKMYTTLCTQRLGKLDEFRQELQSLPKLPPEKAKNFLSNKAGEAWPVPDKNGLFVLTLPAGNSICSIHARRADTKTAEKLFIDLVSKAPAPFVAKKREDNKKGNIRTISYEWIKPDAPLAFAFFLSTNSDANASIQVLGTAAVIKK